MSRLDLLHSVTGASEVGRKGSLSDRGLLSLRPGRARGRCAPERGCRQRDCGRYRPANALEGPLQHTRELAGGCAHPTAEGGYYRTEILAGGTKSMSWGTGMGGAASKARVKVPRR
eukprot:748730-Hanusia_phi.AAC.5